MIPHNLPRFLIPKINLFNNTFRIEDKDQIHKIRKVLRINLEDTIRLFDGEGNEYLGIIKEFGNNKVIGEIIEHEIKIEKKKYKLVLAQALTKSNKIDDILKMNTEIGVDEFIFFESDHSILKLKDIKEKKIERWEKIILESVRQSERNQIPKLNDFLHYKDLIEINYDFKILLHSRIINSGKDMESLIKRISEKENISILVIIGPEGGFSDREIERTSDHSINILNLKLPILRTETAGIAINSHLIISLN